MAAKDAPEGPAVVRGMGWRPDMPDRRDFMLAAPLDVRALPASARVLTKVPVADQGQLGSCTGFMAVYLLEQLRRKNSLAPVDFSPLYTYWATRYLDGGAGQVKVDSGATIRDAVRSLREYGGALEATWPYDIAKFARTPPRAAFRSAGERQVITYLRAATVDALKGSIADGFAVGVGFVVYESMMTSAVDRSGAVPMPSVQETPLGGHAVAIVGYDDSTRRFEFRNSWGAGWGKAGHGFFPYEFVADPQLCMDWWSVRQVES